ncbi:PQ loop repeat-domain-containing protein [Mycena floridula]|nr:PQ loop repeat-domain-containing protein [Mycena floridula]
MSHSDSVSSMVWLGWVSIACWIVVYSPQIYENYSLKSGEGLSVPFVVVWLLGDLCNLGGAFFAGLLPTVIILAAYYSICDIILLGQIYYYRRRQRQQQGERASLLPGESRVPKTEKTPTKLLVAQYTAAILFVFGTGVIAWWISSKLEHSEEPDVPAGSVGWKIQLVGWSSAALYLGSRIPQIFKNFKTRCAGLSPALFLFAIFGNTTYVLAICTKSMSRQYLITNASWLAGSGCTVFLDLFVLSQFFYYQSRDVVQEDVRED